MKLIRIAVPLLLVFARASSAQTLTSHKDSADVVNTVQRMFTAMLQHDTTTLRAVMLPGTRFVVANNDTTPLMPRIQIDSAFIRQIGASKQQLSERMFGPTVHVDGNLAIVWTPYDFHVDGKWSHCGTDTFTLVQTPDGWKVSALAYTVQRKNCPAALRD
jgi:hypothetical protein